MNIKSLEYFLVLAESQSINEAAQKLYVAQPSLTKTLHRMEEELGFTLFKRSYQGIELTPMGRRILPEAQQIVDIYQSWLDIQKENVLSQISIHAHLSFFNFLFPPLILQMKASYPSLTINYTSHIKPERFISRSTKDPALVLVCIDSQEKLDQFTAAQGNPPLVLFQGSYRCLVSTESPLAQKDRVSVEDLDHAMLILPEITDMIGNLSQNQLSALVSNRAKEKMVEVGSLENVMDLVSRQPDTFALSYYPALLRYPGVQAGKLVNIPIQDDRLDGQLCLFYSRRAYRQHPAVRDTVEGVRDSAKQFLAENGL